MCAVCNVDFQTHDSQTLLLYCTSFSAYSEKINPFIYEWKQLVSIIVLALSKNTNGHFKDLVVLA